MSFNDFDSSAAERNPWVDEDTRAIEKVLLVCQKTGHVTHTLVNRVRTGRNGPTQ